MKILSRHNLSYFLILFLAISSTDIAYAAGKGAATPAAAGAGVAKKASQIKASDTAADSDADTEETNEGEDGSASLSDLEASMANLAKGKLGSSAIAKIGPPTVDEDGIRRGLKLDELETLHSVHNPLVDAAATTTVTTNILSRSSINLGSRQLRDTRETEKVFTKASASSTVHPILTKTASSISRRSAALAPMASSVTASSKDSDKPAAAGAGGPLVSDTKRDDVEEYFSEEESDEDIAGSYEYGEEDLGRAPESPVGRRPTHAHAATEPFIRRGEPLAAPDARARLTQSQGAADAIIAAAVVPTAARESVFRNGPEFSIMHGPEGTLSYEPYPHHLMLTSYSREDKNTARFYVTFFGVDGSIEYWKEPKVFIHGSTGPKSATHGGNLFPDSGVTPDYKNFLGWLLQIYPDDVKLTRAYADPVKFFNDQSINRPYHHTEQWILWVIRRDLEARLQEIQRRRPDFRLTNFEINIYTHNNPCADCGPTVEKALPLFERQIAEISTKLGLGFGPVKAFSNISSTKPYGRTHLPMPSLTSEHIDIPPHLTDAKPSYQEVYADSPLVTTGPLAIAATHGKVHHFWIPRLWGVTFAIENGLLKATLNSPSEKPRKESSLTNLSFFLDGFSTHSHVAERVRILDFGGYPLKFTTSEEFGTIDPRSFYNSIPFHSSVARLSLYGTNARSIYIPDMLGAFEGLTHLDLRGAIQEYKDYKENPAQPRKELWAALRGLPLLTDLDLGVYTRPTAAGAGAVRAVPTTRSVSNGITFAEFAFILSVPAGAGAGAAAAGPVSAVPFPSIQVLKLNGNQIFAAAADAEKDTAGGILKTFIKAPGRATPPTEINLSDNGKYMHVSAAQLGRSLLKEGPPISTDIIF